jgi:GDP-4-dehydro-6-deoxy-D-mannose reductase
MKTATYKEIVDSQVAIVGSPASVADQIDEFVHEYRIGNLLNFKEIRDILNETKPVHVYHLASQSSVGLSHQKPFETLNTNLLGTQNLLEAVRRIVPNAKVMLLSSSEIYGRGFGQLTVLHREEDTPNPLTSYATSKACMELLGNQFRNAYGMHIVAVRPFHYTGPNHSRRFLLPDIAYRLVQMEKHGAEPVLYTGHLDITRDVVDVRDVARAMISILNTSPSGAVYNICSGKTSSFRDLVDLLVEIAGLRVDFYIDPSRERQNEIPLLIGDPTRIMETGWKPMISMEDSLLDLYKEMRYRDRCERLG